MNDSPYSRERAGDSEMKLFVGRSNPTLNERILRSLREPAAKALLGEFSDGELRVEINENVRGCDAFIIQSLCQPTNRNLMELLLMADALSRASAERITAIIPYFGYARQDRRPRSLRVPITAKIVANLLQSCKIDRVLTVDLHAEQIQGFFDMPVDNLYGSALLDADIWKRWGSSDITIVSPDTGGVARARATAKEIGADIVIVDKRRPGPNESEIMNIIGEVKGKVCVLVDDIVDTAGTLCQASVALRQQGAEKVVAYAVHPVLSGKALENIANSQLDELVVTDTIPLAEEAVQVSKITQLSAANMLAEAIRRLHSNESINVFQY